MPLQVDKLVELEVVDSISDERAHRTLQETRGLPPPLRSQEVPVCLDEASEQLIFEAFASGRARRIAERLEIHHTPKYGSWLNLAEIELSVLSRQCLDRRNETRGELRFEV